MNHDTRHTHTLGEIPGATHDLIRRLAANDRLGKIIDLDLAVTRRNRHRGRVLRGWLLAACAVVTGLLIKFVFLSP